MARRFDLADIEEVELFGEVMARTLKSEPQAAAASEFLTELNRLLHSLRGEAISGKHASLSPVDAETLERTSRDLLQFMTGENNTENQIRARIGAAAARLAERVQEATGVQDK